MLRHPRVDINAADTESWRAIHYCCVGFLLDLDDLEMVTILLQRSDFEINARALPSSDFRGGDHPLWFALQFLCSDYNGYGPDDPRIPRVEMAKLLANDHRISREHLQAGLVTAARGNYVRIVKVLLDSKKQRIDSRAVDIAKQSGIGMFLPQEVFDVNLVPFVGGRDQAIITQEVFDAISDRLSNIQAVRMVYLLKDFLNEYGNVDEFDIPDVFI